MAKDLPSVETIRGSGAEKVQNNPKARSDLLEEVMKYAPVDQQQFRHRWLKVAAPSSDETPVRVKKIFRVEITSAEQLRKISLSPPNPVATCMIVDKPETKWSTGTLRGTDAPRWSAVQEMTVEEGDYLVFKVKSKSLLKLGKYHLGSGHLENDAFFDSGFSGEVDLYDANANGAPVLHVKISPLPSHDLRSGGVRLRLSK
jgi:hypothetical protein